MYTIFSKRLTYGQSNLTRIFIVSKLNIYFISINCDIELISQPILPGPTRDFIKAKSNEEFFLHVEGLEIKSKTTIRILTIVTPMELSILSLNVTNEAYFPSPFHANIFKGHKKGKLTWNELIKAMSHKTSECKDEQLRSVFICSMVPCFEHGSKG